MNIRSFLKVLFVYGLFALAATKLNAQIAIQAGGNFCNVKSDVLLENKNSIGAYHFGFGIQYFPVKNFSKLSLVNEFIFTQKGYQQNFSNDYFFRFNYLAFPILVNYSPVPFLSLQGGVELSTLVSTNIKQGMKTYNHFDSGLVAGISAFDNRRFSIYSRVTYGLSSMLDYVLIDEMGNFDGEMKDLHNVCFSLGIKFKLINEKIILHK